MGIILKVTSRNEHVPEIERYIRMVKERVQAIVYTLPFKQYPNRLIIETVYNATFWLTVSHIKMAFTQHFAQGQ